MRTLGRLLLVPLAFVVATVLAGLVLVTLGQERAMQALGGRGPDETAIDAAFDLYRLAGMLFSKTTLLPALLLVIVGEVARLRSIVYYVLGGGLALVAVPVLARLDQSGAIELPVVVAQVFATAGFAGGFVYWLLAGRRA